jgi:hypothetical protein
MKAGAHRRKVAELSVEGQEVGLNLPDTFDIDVPDTFIEQSEKSR